MRKEILIFKKLFGGLTKGKEPTPEGLILIAIRERLLPLGFIESKDSHLGPVARFTRDKIEVYWTKDNRDLVYYFEITNKRNMLVNMGCPQSGDLKEFQIQVLKALDDWLNTI